MSALEGSHAAGQRGRRPAGRRWWRAAVAAAAVTVPVAVSGAAALPAAAAPSIVRNHVVSHTIPVGMGPAGVGVYPTTHTAYVANSGADTVSVITSATVTATIPVGTQPVGVAVDTVSNKVYVANSGDNTVSVISGGVVTATVPVGSSPFGVAVDTATTPHTIYVTNSADDTVSVIDAATDTVTGTIAVGMTPMGVAVDTGTTPSTVYVANAGENTVSVIRSGAVTDTIPVRNMPVGVAVDPATHVAWVADSGSGTVSRISGGVPAEIVTGGSPRGVAVDTVTHNVYVTSSDTSGRVFILSPAGLVTDTLMVGVNPDGVAVDSTVPAAYVANSGSNTVSRITTAPTLTVTTTSLPSGGVGGGYTATLRASGGTPPYVWAIGGSLPPGLRLEPGTGVISGVPTTAGTFSFTARVTDSERTTAQRPLSITVNAPLMVHPPTLPNGTVGTAYSQTLTATGGVAPYTWSLFGNGMLPPGLTFNATTHTISGTPTRAGSYTFAVQVIDSQRTMVRKQYTIGIRHAPLVITTSSLPNATAGHFYSASLSATGGAPPYMWSITGGALPPGLGLHGNVISGTPPKTAGGHTYSFTVRVTDQLPEFTTKQLSIHVNS